MRGQRLKALAAIDDLKELSSGWDSYEADPVALAARESAKRFLRRIAEILGAEYANPVVGPTPEGGVALLWRRPGAPKIEVSFSPTGSIRYVVPHHGKLLERGPVVDPDSIVTSVLKRYLIA